VDGVRKQTAGAVSPFARPARLRPGHRLPRTIELVIMNPARGRGAVGQPFVEFQIRYAMNLDHIGLEVVDDGFEAAARLLPPRACRAQEIVNITGAAKTGLRLTAVNQGHGVARPAQPGRDVQNVVVHLSAHRGRRFVQDENSHAPPFSNSRACARADSLLPPSIRAISSTRAAPATSASCETVRPSRNSFVTTK